MNVHEEFGIYLFVSILHSMQANGLVLKVEIENVKKKFKVFCEVHVFIAQ